MREPTTVGVQTSNNNTTEKHTDWYDSTTYYIIVAVEVLQYGTLVFTDNIAAPVPVKEGSKLFGVRPCYEPATCCASVPGTYCKYYNRKPFFCTQLPLLRSQANASESTVLRVGSQ